MRKIILKVMKEPYREESGLTFFVFKPIVLTGIYEGDQGYQYVEHYENLFYLDKHKTGSQVRFFTTEETENDVHYEVNGSYEEGMLSAIADEVTSNSNDYVQQYEEFLYKANHALQLTKI